MEIAKIPITEEFVIVMLDLKSKLDTGPEFNMETDMVFTLGFEHF